MTNAELAILSLIAEKPRHGYEIEQIIEERGMRDWTEIGFSSIYYLLNKLEKSRLIESQLQHPEGRGPARKVYTITPQGWHTQVVESTEALANPGRGSVPFLLGLSNLPIIPKEQALEALDAYADCLVERREHLLQRVAEQRPLPPFVEAMFDYSITLVEAELDWMRKFIQEVEAGNVY
ncbi:MAG: PadR family transcriptional regulator [Chloroflexi bacterium]|nr:PadR family transcriptional regulator [Chloroflexota bacterium]